MIDELTDEHKAILDRAVACCGREAVLAKLYAMMSDAAKREAGYPEGEAPGTSMYELLPYRGGCVRTLPTDSDEWNEDAHYAALPEDKETK